MIVPGSTNPLLMRSAAVAAYQISRSLRFDASNTGNPPYVSRTFTSTGNRRTFTFSCWVKKSGVDSTKQYALLGRTGNSFVLQFDANSLKIIDTGSITAGLVTAAVFRDPSAWYHVVMSVDTTQATASNRVRLYINGVQQTLSGTQPTQNSDLNINTNVTHRIGATGTSVIERVLDGYLADIYFLDGTATTPSTFAETNATTGAWNPITPASITYGTNGFHLDFSDNSDTTSTTLGKDSSGNNNDWNPSNFSVTAGSGNDSLTDTPTSYGTDTGTGGEVRGNYATLNPNNQRNSITLSNGNLDLLSTTSTYAMSAGTIACVEKTYFEVRVGGPISGGRNAYFGVGSNGDINRYNNNYLGSDALAWSLGHDGNAIYYISHNGSFTSVSGTAVAGDILMFAIDPPNGKIWFGRNGTWYAGTPAAGTGASYTNLPSTVFPILQGYNTGPHSANFGQRAFAYTAPSGFKALVDTNLTAPTIAKPSTVFDVVTYTGTGSALTPTSSLGFSPDLIWIKSRSAATDHTLYDTVRGAEKRLESNNTDAEVTSDGGVTAFNSNGFTLGTLAQVNTNAATYVGWCWDGGTSTVTNTNGTITSSVRANASAGISIVSYTGNGTSGATVGHGLNVAPSFYVCKFRNTNTTSGPWYTYHKSLGATQALTLNTTDATSTLSSIWNNTEPSSTVFSLGNAGDTNGSGRNFIAYCFAPVSGFSSFGSYTGNGSADGPLVYLGFRPALLVVKMSSSTGNWTILDHKRAGYNVDNDPLYPNLANAEGTTDLIDITSNGFKIRTTDATFNTSSGTYVYAAWASAPFPYARAR